MNGQWLTVLVLTGALACAGSGGASRAASACLSGRVLVNEGGVGPLPRDSAVRVITSACREARDTFLLSEHSRNAAIVIHGSGVTIVGLQLDSILRLDRPIQVWTASGDSVMLPDSLSLRSPWYRLVNAYGRYVSDPDPFDADQSGVVFCKMPGMGFTVPSRVLAGGADSAGTALSVSISRDNAMYVSGPCK